jgi:hypothetical protein
LFKYHCTTSSVKFIVVKVIKKQEGKKQEGKNQESREEGRRHRGRVMRQTIKNQQEEGGLGDMKLRLGTRKKARRPGVDLKIRR